MPRRSSIRNGSGIRIMDASTPRKLRLLPKTASPGKPSSPITSKPSTGKSGTIRNSSIGIKNSSSPSSTPSMTLPHILSEPKSASSMNPVKPLTRKNSLVHQTHLQRDNRRLASRKDARRSLYLFHFPSSHPIAYQAPSANKNSPTQMSGAVPFLLLSLLFPQHFLLHRNP